MTYKAVVAATLLADRQLTVLKSVATMRRERRRQEIAMTEKPSAERAEHYADAALLELANAWGDIARLYTPHGVSILQKHIAAALADAKAARVLDPTTLQQAAEAALAEFCQPTISVVWTELQPLAKDKWLRIARAALDAAKKFPGC